MADPVANVFGDSPPVTKTPEGVSSNSSNNVETLLATIKNEDGKQKYDTIEKAIEALAHSQSYIPQIKSQLTEKEIELERIKSELDKRESIEEVVKRLTASRTPDEDYHPAPVGLDEQAVQKLVEQSLGKTLTAREALTKYQGNVSKVQDTLIQRYGDKASEVVAKKASELGITPKDIEGMAGNNPAVVLELFKAQGESTPNPTTHGRNIPPINNQVQELKRPEKSLLRGGSNKERADFMKEIQKQVYARHGITEG